MPPTVIRGKQVLDGTIQRADLDTTTVGQAVVAKIVQGTNVTLSSTGGDSGTGDVTISVPSGGTGPAGPAGANAWTLTGASFTVPAIGASVVATVADTSWVAVGETVWVAGTPDALVVSAKTPTTLTLINPPTSGNPGVSTDAGNQATLGSDKLIYVPPISVAASFIVKTTSYTLSSGDSGKYVICSGGSWTLTLPVPASGLNYRLRNDMGITGTTGTITLQPNGGTIDGKTSLALLPQQECTLLTDGTNWRTHGLSRQVILGTQDITSAQASAVVLLPLGYRFFELEFTGFLSSAADTLIGQLSSDGGTTWLATNYYHGVIYNNTASAVAYSNIEAGAFFYILATNVASPVGEARLVIYPGSGSAGTTWRCDSTARQPSNNYKWNGGGFLNISPIAMNALKYYCNGGSNISNCFLTVKGVV